MGDALSKNETDGDTATNPGRDGFSVLFSTVVRIIYVRGETTKVIRFLTTSYAHGTIKTSTIYTISSTIFPGSTTTLTVLSTEYQASFTTNHTHLGPLTTTFTPPSSCLTDIYFALTSPYPRLGWPTKSECYPSRFTEPPSQFTRGYFSPGICPSGYTQACSQYMVPLKPSETASNCCPTGYMCNTPSNGEGHANQNICTSFVSESATFARMADDESTELAIPQSMTVYAPAIQIRWRPSDSTPSTLQPTIRPAETGVELGPQPTADPGFQQIVPHGSRASLSRAGKIGIGVAVPVVIIGFLILAVLLYRRRKSAGTHGGENLSAPEFDIHGYPAPIGLGSAPPKYELATITVPVENGFTPLPEPRFSGGQGYAGSSVYMAPSEASQMDDTQGGGPSVWGGGYWGEVARYGGGTNEQFGIGGQVSNVVEDDELRWLQEEQDRLDGERRRRLEELNEQQERVRRRMQERMEAIGRRDGGL